MIAIKKICVSNFKSFDGIDLTLNDCNVIVGANSSGKSNFIECFAFLRNLETKGLAEAISLSGGKDFFSNISSRKSTTKFEVHIESPAKRLIKKPKKDDPAVGIASTELKYSIEFEPKADEPKIIAEEVVIKYDIWQLKKEKREYKNDKKLDSFDLTITRGTTSQKTEYAGNKNNVNLIIKPSKELPFKLKDLFVLEYKDSPTIPKRKTLIESPFFMPHTPWMFFGRAFDIKIFDFEPKAVKNNYVQSESGSLKRNGENVAMLIKTITEDKVKKEKFIRILKQFLPYVENIRVESFLGKLVALEINEKYSSTKIPVPLLSDGTINVLCLILVFFFDKSEVIFIEEPEKNVHPQLISLLTKMAEDVSKNKQVFLSTHNVDVVKNSNPQNIVVVSRDSNGVSNVFRATDNAHFSTMLKNKVELADIFRTNILK